MFLFCSSQCLFLTIVCQTSFISDKYCLSVVKTSWEQAATICKSISAPAHLAYIESLSENSEITYRSTTLFAEYAWHGLKYSQDDGK